MTIKLYQAAIKGIAPLLHHKFHDGGDLEIGAKTRSVNGENLTPRDQAERACYRHYDGNLYIPGAAIARMLREAGGSHKQRGTRKSLKYIVPAGVIVLSDTLDLLDDDGSPLVDFEIDSRPVVIPATKGRIMRHRPRLDVWRLVVELQIDTSVLDVDTVHQLLEEGGRRIGIGDFRPERGGSFGRFEIVAWSPLD